MAHSYVELGDTREQIHDSQLEIVIYMVAEQVRDAVLRGEIDGATYEPVISRWTSQSVLGCTGCMELDLDKLVVSEQRRHEISSLLRRIEEKVCSFGERTSAQYLNELTGSTGLSAYREDPDASLLLNAVRKFIRVVEEGALQPVSRG